MRSCLNRFIHFRDQIISGQFIPLRHVRVQVLAKGYWTWKQTATRLRKLHELQKNNFKAQTWGSEKSYWRWDHHFIRSSKSLEGPAVTGWLVPSPRIWIAQRTELEKCDKGARGVMGKRKAKRNEWSDDMSGLQGEDSFFISKLF